MPQAKITNHTRCEYQVLFANDEAFRPVVTPIIKATFDIGLDGRLTFSEKQNPVCLEGEFFGDPETSSYIFEPECAFMKPSTDVILIGDAISNRGPVTHLLVDIQVGHLRKKIGTIGDRQWLKKSFGYAISDVKPFDSLPLIYENAFGGWDKRGPKAEDFGFEPRNTVGKGFYRTDVAHLDLPMYLPNLENPDSLIQNLSDRPEPAGCGFTLPHWQPRVNFAGSYDKQWEETRNPLLPLDFDRKYFNAASADLIATNYLVGNEPVILKNMTPNGLLQFVLPGACAPVCKVDLKDFSEELHTLLDTVIINTREMQLQLIWRNHLLLDQGPHDVDAIDIYYG